MNLWYSKRKTNSHNIKYNFCLRMAQQAGKMMLSEIAGPTYQIWDENFYSCIAYTVLGDRVYKKLAI